MAFQDTNLIFGAKMAVFSGHVWHPPLGICQQRNFQVSNEATQIVPHEEEPEQEDSDELAIDEDLLDEDFDEASENEVAQEPVVAKAS
jgi:hypothetical protein